MIKGLHHNAYRCRDSEETRRVYEEFLGLPLAHTLEITVSVASGRLRIVTSVHASGGCEVPVSFGWHPYWRVPGGRDSWNVEFPEVAHLQLDRRGLPTGRAQPEARHAIVLAGQEFDDLYAFAGPGRSVTLTGARRRLRLDFDAGYPYLQVFAPGDGRFCCVEPMTAPTNALVNGDHRVVPAGATFSATFSATVT